MLSWVSSQLNNFSQISACSFCSCLYPEVIIPQVHLLTFCLISHPSKQLQPSSLYRSLGKIIYKTPTISSSLPHIELQLKQYSGFLGGSEDKTSVAIWETWVWFLGREDPLEKEMATHSSTLACKIPWMEKPGRL